MRERLVVERSCEHGNFGLCGHQPLSNTGECAIYGCVDPSHSCTGGSREVIAEEIPPNLEPTLNEACETCGGSGYIHGNSKRGTERISGCPDCTLTDTRRTEEE